MGARLSTLSSKSTTPTPFQLPQTDAEIAKATHYSPPTSLPPPTATPAEIRHFLYKILTLDPSQRTSASSQGGQKAAATLQAILTNSRHQDLNTKPPTSAPDPDLPKAALPPTFIRALVAQWTGPSTSLRQIAKDTINSPPRPGPKLNGKGFLNLDYEIGRFHCLCSEKDRWSAQMQLRRVVGRLLREEEAERERERVEREEERERERVAREEEREREQVVRERFEREARDVWEDGWGVVRRWEGGFLPREEGKRKGEEGGSEGWHDSGIGSEVEDEVELKEGEQKGRVLEGQKAVVKEMVKGEGDVKAAFSVSIEVGEVVDVSMGYGIPGRRTWGL